MALSLWLIERLPAVIMSWSELSIKLHEINATKQQLITSSPTATKKITRAQKTLLRLCLVLGILCIALPALSGKQALSMHLPLVASGIVFIFVPFGLVFIELVPISMDIVNLRLDNLSMQVTID